MYGKGINKNLNYGGQIYWSMFVEDGILVIKIKLIIND
tara:strand:- start:921 stop:1034 length:114 start_codon:yes stop_codon:yes gene_type:complete